MKVGVKERRRFLKLLGAAGLGVPLTSGAVRRELGRHFLSEAAAQAAAEPTLFVEVNLREQMDLMHVMVPPSIAKYPNRIVGSNGEQLTLFAPQNELKEYPNNVFLTNDSLELAPHIDSVAMLDTGQPSIGNVHGLEAGCGMRSPGRVMDGGASGLAPMWLNDGEHAASSEELYANVPTPATLHNYYQKQHTPNLVNGYAFKGLSTTKNSCYHFAAGLPDAELNRIKSKADLLAAFGASYQAAAFPGPPELVDEIRKAALAPYVKRGGPGEQALIERFSGLAALASALELSAEEVGYWSAGVPPQMCEIGNANVMPCGADAEHAVTDGWVKAQIWEQFAHASKLLRSGLVHSVALEFDYGHLDGDGVRTEMVQRVNAQQIARPLARFITLMKAAGLYERTLVAVYLVDGSHRPAANSYSYEGKGTFLLAGGKVRGGYYGDILIESDLPNGAGHTYAFRPPHPTTGALLPAVSDWTDHAKRTPDAAVWRSVVRAMGLPESEYVGKFSKLLDDAEELDFLLKA